MIPTVRERTPEVAIDGVPGRKRHRLGVLPADASVPIEVLATRRRCGKRRPRCDVVGLDELEHLGLGDDPTSTALQSGSRLFEHVDRVAGVPERETGEQTTHRSARDDDIEVSGVRSGHRVRMGIRALAMDRWESGDGSNEYA